MPQQGLRIGRAPENDVVLPDANVSRQHLVLWTTPRGAFLRDLGSQNGTFINGRRVGTGRGPPQRGADPCWRHRDARRSVRGQWDRSRDRPHHRRQRAGSPGRRGWRSARLWRRGRPQSGCCAWTKRGCAPRNIDRSDHRRHHRFRDRGHDRHGSAGVPGRLRQPHLGDPDRDGAAHHGQFNLDAAQHRDDRTEADHPTIADRAPEADRAPKPTTARPRRAVAEIRPSCGH